MARLGPSSRGHTFFVPPALAADPPAVGAIAWSQADDAWSLAGASLASGAIAWTQADNAWALSGAALASGSIAWTQGPDVWALSGTVALTASGAIAWTQDAGAWALAAAARASGPIAITQDANALAVSEASSAAAVIALASSSDSWGMAAGVEVPFLGEDWLWPSSGKKRRRKEVREEEETVLEPAITVAQWVAKETPYREVIRRAPIVMPTLSPAQVRELYRTALAAFKHEALRREAEDEAEALLLL